MKITVERKPILFQCLANGMEYVIMPIVPPAEGVNVKVVNVKTA